MQDSEHVNYPVSLEENLKKALTELLLLQLLSKKDYYIGELTVTLNQQSNGALSIVFPYGAIYRLLQAGFVIESEKRIAPDGRRRQYYQITNTGRVYLEKLIGIYSTFSKGVDAVLVKEGEKHG